MALIPNRVGRVCLVVRDEPGVTGTSRYVDRLRAGLVARGIEVVEVSTRSRGLPGRALGAGRRVGLDFNAFLATYPQRLRWPKADVYHLTIQTYAGALLLGPPTGPSVVTVHDIVPHLTRDDAALSGLSSPIHRRANARAMRGLRAAHRLITPSVWTKAGVIEQVGVESELIDVVPLAVDHDIFNPEPPKADFYARHGLDPQKRYLLNVGSEDPRKNLESVVRALPEILRAAPDAVLLRVGPAYSAERRANLTRLATDLGVAHAIRYVGAVDDHELAAFYNAAEVMVMPSLFEGFGLPVLEAMACGTPVVTTARAALAEIANSSVARIVEPHNTTAIAGAVVDLLTDQLRANAMAGRATGWAQSYTWSRVIDATVASYVAAIATARVPARGRAIAPSQVGS